MSDLNPKGMEIELGGTKYKMLLTINVIDDLQDQFDAPISDILELLDDGRKQFKVIKALLSAMINEGIDEFDPSCPHVTERLIGRKLDMQELSAADAREKIFGAFAAGMPKMDDENVPNEQSGQ